MKEGNIYQLAFLAYAYLQLALNNQEISKKIIFLLCNMLIKLRICMQR